MELWLDILMDALIDSIKLFPFLLLTYLLMEYLQHKDEGVDSESRQAGTYRRRCRRNFSTMWIFGSRFKSVLRWNHYDGNAGGSVFIDLG